jgi:hypothetical protein
VSADASATPGTGSARAGALRIVGLDIVGPLVIYRLSRSAGLPQIWALVVSGSTPGLGVVVDYVRWRTLEVVGAIVLAGIVISVALALISGSTRAVLLESAAGNGLFGLACLGSLTRRRPLLFYFIQAFYGGRHSDEGVLLEQNYTEHPEARSYFRAVTAVWGVTYVIEAALLAMVVLSVSTGTALVVNRVTPWIVFSLLFAWTYRWGMRMRVQREDVATR